MNMRQLVQKHVPNAPLSAPKRSKYGNRKTVLDGMVFDSAGESHRWAELKLLERAGQIHDLRRQVEFSCEVNGHLVTKYLADFTYTEDGQKVVEDFKSKPTETALFRIKAKLLFACHGIVIKITRSK